jgi:hypothetical protein
MSLMKSQILSSWLRRSWLCRVRIHVNRFLGSGSLYRKVFLLNFFDRTPFDRNTIWPNTVSPNTIWPKGHLNEKPFDRSPFDRIAVWPNRRLTEHRSTESSFYRKIIRPIFFFRKWSFDRINLRQKMSFDRIIIAQKVVWPKILDRKFIWPTAFTENGHLTEWSFKWKYIWPKAF